MTSTTSDGPHLAWPERIIRGKAPRRTRYGDVARGFVATQKA